MMPVATLPCYQQGSINPNEWFFCAISIQKATEKTVFAQASSVRLARNNHTLSLDFQTQDHPFPEMLPYLLKRASDVLIDRHCPLEQYHIFHWLQKYDPQNKVWQLY